MKVAIISDVHNNTTNLKKVLDFCAKESAGGRIEKIICCGDLSSNETLDFLNDNFDGKIFYAIGNAEDGQLNGMENISEYKKTKIFQDFGELIVADGGVATGPLYSGPVAPSSRTVAFVHYPREAKKLAESGKYDFVFYGHTHKPWTEKINKCETLNPGNVAGEIYPPTFAVWNTDDGKFDLIRVHDLK